MLFFFSSRRRHTRLTCDWSSDVCSSDLVEDGGSDVAVRAVLAREVAVARVAAALEVLVRAAGVARRHGRVGLIEGAEDRKSTRLNSSHMSISYAVFCLKKKKKKKNKIST